MVLDSGAEATSACASQGTTTPGGMMDHSRAGRLNRPQMMNTNMVLTVSRQKVRVMLLLPKVVNSDYCKTFGCCYILADNAKNAKI